MSMIKVEHLKYKYPDAEHKALDDISFTIEKGEFVAIIGKHHAGKSTLCQALIGLIPHFYKGAYGGGVMIKDKEVKTHPIHELSEHVGFIFQDPFTQVTGSKLTVDQEVAFGLENLGVAKEDMMKRVDWALSVLHLTAYKQHNPFELSGGQMQRLAIAGVIAMKPDVIILDEPTSQLDPQGSAEVFQAIEQLRQEGMTVLMVEQKMEKVAQYAARVLLLNEGQLVDDDSPEKVFSRADLEDYGIQAPVYTRIAKQLDMLKVEGCYPVTEKQIYERLVTTYD